jgi:hypothetical protein
LKGVSGLSETRLAPHKKAENINERKTGLRRMSHIVA